MVYGEKGVGSMFFGGGIYTKILSAGAVTINGINSNSYEGTPNLRELTGITNANKVVTTDDIPALTKSSKTYELGVSGIKARRLELMMKTSQAGCQNILDSTIPIPIQTIR